jgi:predicted lipid-binding transport protein (Tim44 family)
VKRSVAAAATVPALSATTLLGAPDALARAGSGSSGFSGGGHSFGGGFSRGGGGFHSFGFGGGLGGGGYSHGGSAGVGLVAFVIFLLIVAYVLWRFAWPMFQRWSAGAREVGAAGRQSTAKRERRVELAAAEASEDNEAFAPEFVRSSAARLFIDIQSAWDADDRIRLRGLVAPELLSEWELRLDDFERKGWRNRVEPIGEPRIEYVGLTNRNDAAEDRVVVRIEAKLTDYVQDGYGQRVHRNDRLGDVSHVREFWTLALRNSHWILASIEQGGEGSHALSDAIIASPFADDNRMRDEALVEHAVQDAAPNPAELITVGYDQDAQAAANDLSVADGRFAPDILEVAARRAAAAWAAAVDGSDARLIEIAHQSVVNDMLHPTPRTRLVVRGPQVQRIHIRALDAASTPPMMTVEVQIHGPRYIEDRSTAQVVQGSKDRAITFIESWTMALDGPPEEPWRIARVNAPAKA